MQWKHIEGTVQGYIKCLDTTHAITVTAVR